MRSGFIIIGFFSILSHLQAKTKLYVRKTSNGRLVEIKPETNYVFGFKESNGWKWKEGRVLSHDSATLSIVATSGYRDTIRVKFDSIFVVTKPFRCHPVIEDMSEFSTFALMGTLLAPAVWVKEDFQTALTVGIVCAGTATVLFLPVLIDRWFEKRYDLRKNKWQLVVK